MWRSALAAQVRPAATGRPSRRRSAAPSSRPRPSTASRASASVGRVAGRHQQGRPAGQLGHGRPRRGHQGRPAGQGLEGRQAVALLERGVGHHRRPERKQRRDRLVGHVAGAHHPVGVDAARGHGPSTSSAPHPVRPARTSAGLGWYPAHRGRRPGPGRARPCGARWCRRRPPGAAGSSPSAGQRRLVGPGRRLGSGPNRGGRRRGGPPPPAPGGHRPRQALGRRPAHADDGRGPPGRHPDGPAEDEHLGSLVPLGVVEEGAVVHRHHHRHPGPLGHRVVGAVVHVRRRPRRSRPGRRDLLPDQPAGRAARAPTATHQAGPVARPVAGERSATAHRRRRAGRPPRSSTSSRPSQGRRPARGCSGRPRPGWPAPRSRRATTQPAPDRRARAGRPTPTGRRGAGP